MAPLETGRRVNRHIAEETGATMENTRIVSRYSRVAILLHWVLAAALAGQIALGFSMPRNASGFALFQLHKSIGITILVLSVFRLIWRLTHARPAETEGGFTGFLAKAVHWGFYAFMILGPLTGWALVSTAAVNVPTLIFGVIPLPHLPLSGDSEIWEGVHELLAYMGMALFLLHVAGALRHQFFIRDNLLANSVGSCRLSRAWWAWTSGRSPLNWQARKTRPILPLPKRSLRPSQHRKSLPMPV